MTSQCLFLINVRTIVLTISCLCSVLTTTYTQSSCLPETINFTLNGYGGGTKEYTGGNFYQSMIYDMEVTLSLEAIKDQQNGDIVKYDLQATQPIQIHFWGTAEDIFLSETTICNFDVTSTIESSNVGFLNYSLSSGKVDYLKFQFLDPPLFPGDCSPKPYSVEFYGDSILVVQVEMPFPWTFWEDEYPANGDMPLDWITCSGDFQIFPDYGGNTGDVTVNIYGNNFTDDSTIKLSRSGEEDITVPDSLLKVIDAERILAQLDLRGKTTGAWDVVISNPDEIIENGFEIQDGIPVDLWSEIIGFEAIRPGQWQTYTVVYGNNGNTDAWGVPLWLALPPNAEVALEFEIDPPGDNLLDYDTIPLFIPVDSISGQPFQANVYSFILPYVSPNSSGNLRFKIKVNDGDNIRMAVWTTGPFFRSDLDEAIAECYNAEIEALWGLIPGFSCIYGILNPWYSVFSDEVFGTNTNNPTSTIWTFASTTISCLSWVNPYSIVLQVLSQLVTASEFHPACLKMIPAALQEYSISILNSYDPNDKIGPVGQGIARYISGDLPIHYQIRLENIDTATAPVQTATIIDTLDSEVFDFETLQLGFISLGNKTISIPPGKQEFTKDIDFSDELGVIARIEVFFIDSTAILSWQFTTLDPTTLEPIQNPFLGFLPPNLIPPEGEGSVFYSIRLKESLDLNTVIQNKAYITFDNNTPIVTNTWNNTLDNIAPVSEVNNLANPQPDTSFLVSWSGSDVGSGIETYSVYVATNDGDFVPWLLNTFATSDIFTGQIDSTYHFYSIARDSALNIELIPDLPDATTTINNIIGRADENFEADYSLIIDPNPVIRNGEINLIIESSKRLEVQIQIIDVYGRFSFSNEEYIISGKNLFHVPTPPIAGLYFIVLKGKSGGMTIQKLIVQ